jgi:tetratricopeptide (TPR) repeat protein
VNRFFFFLLLFSGFCFAHEELSQQIREISAQIQQAPANAELYLRRAELNRTDARWKDAERDYRKAKNLAPGLDAADFGLALLYYDQHRFQDSLHALNQFLAKHPEHAAGLLTRARIYKETGDWPRALENYSKSLAIQPDPEIYIERANGLMSQNRNEEALTGLNEGLHVLGPAVTLELTAIELELQLKRYDDALVRVDEIAAQADRKEIWLMKRAEILRKASRNAEAKDNYLEALKNIDGLPESRRNTEATRELREKILTAIEELGSTASQ